MFDVEALVLDPAAQAAALEATSIFPGWPSDPPGNAIDPLIWAIVEDLKKMPDLHVFDVEPNHFHHGYASFVEVKLTRSDNLGVEIHDGIEVTGFGLLINRLAPIAALQATAHTYRRRDGRGGGGSLPHCDDHVSLPVPGYPEAGQIEPILQRYEYTIIDPSILSMPIAPGLAPETNLGDPPWTVFDAWFYWFD